MAWKILCGFLQQLLANQSNIYMNSGHFRWVLGNTLLLRYGERMRLTPEATPNSRSSASPTDPLSDRYSDNGLALLLATSSSFATGTKR